MTTDQTLAGTRPDAYQTSGDIPPLLYRIRFTDRDHLRALIQQYGPAVRAVPGGKGYVDETDGSLALLLPVGTDLAAVADMAAWAWEERSRYRTRHDRPQHVAAKQATAAERRALNYRYDQGLLTTRDPDTGRVVSVQEYVRRVQTGTWRMNPKPLVIGGADDARRGEVVAVPLDPVVERFRSANTREGWLERFGRRYDGRPQAGDAAPLYRGRDRDVLSGDDLLHEQPLIAALAEGAGDDGWRWTVTDPAEAWCDAKDVRNGKASWVAWTLRRRDRVKRHRLLDKLLSYFSAAGDDPDYIGWLIEWVRAKDSTYRAHCLTQRDNLGRRGRKSTTKRREGAETATVA